MTGYEARDPPVQQWSGRQREGEDTEETGSVRS